MDSDETKQRLIDVTISLLDQQGNHSLRLADVAREAGVAVSTIYAHFRDRTDLVAAARLQQFRSHANGALDAVERSMEPDLRPESFIELSAWPSLLDPDDHDAKVRRWDRIEAIADSRHIPDLARQLEELQGTLNSRVVDLLDTARENGWIDPDLDPAAIAMMSQVLRLGLVHWDISGATRPDPDAWATLIRRVFGCIVRDDVSVDAALASLDEPD